MTDADAGSGWVVEPPGPDAALIRVDFAEASELTPELRQALDTLVRTLEASGEIDEVQAFAACKKLACDVVYAPCAARTIVECTVTGCPRYVPAP